MIGLLVIAPLVAIWLGWRHSVPLAIVAVGILWLIMFAVQRWGDGFFPLVPGAGGYYIRVFPFGR